MSHSRQSLLSGFTAFLNVGNLYGKSKTDYRKDVDFYPFRCSSWPILQDNRFCFEIVRHICVRILSLFCNSCCSCSCEESSSVGHALADISDSLNTENDQSWGRVIFVTSPRHRGPVVLPDYPQEVCPVRARLSLKMTIFCDMLVTQNIWQSQSEQ